MTLNKFKKKEGGDKFPKIVPFLTKMLTFNYKYHFHTRYNIHVYIDVLFFVKIMSKTF